MRAMRQVAIAVLMLASINGWNGPSSVSAADECEEGKLQLYLPECTEGTGDVLFLVDTSKRASKAYAAQLVSALPCFGGSFLFDFLCTCDAVPLFPLFVRNCCKPTLSSARCMLLARHARAAHPLDLSRTLP